MKGNSPKDVVGKLTSYARLLQCYKKKKDFSNEKVAYIEVPKPFSRTERHGRILAQLCCTNRCLIGNPVVSQMLALTENLPL